MNNDPTLQKSSVIKFLSKSLSRKENYVKPIRSTIFFLFLLTLITAFVLIFPKSEMLLFESILSNCDKDTCSVALTIDSDTTSDIMFRIYYDNFPHNYKNVIKYWSLNQLYSLSVDQTLVKTECIDFYYARNAKMFFLERFFSLNNTSVVFPCGLYPLFYNKGNLISKHSAFPKQHVHTFTDHVNSPEHFNQDFDPKHPARLFNDNRH